MDWASIFVAFCAAFSAVVVLITALIAKNQLKESAKANKQTAFINLINLVQNEDARAARTYLFGELKSKKRWSRDDEKIAEKACHPYDSVGQMVTRGLIEEDLVLGWWDSIVKCWEISEKMIMKYRKTRGNDFWGEFEKLYIKAKAIKEKMKQAV